MAEERFKQMDETATKNANRVSKGLVTRFSRLIKEACAQVTGDAAPSRALIDDIKKTRAQLEASVKDVTAAYNRLMEITPADEKKFTDELNTYMATADDAIKACHKVYAATRGPAARDNEERRVKEVATLKPKELTREATPSEFREWEKEFERYYRASNMEAAEIEEQRGYLDACLSKDIRRYLNQMVGENTRIFPPERWYVDSEEEDRANAEMLRNLAGNGGFLPTATNCMEALKLEFKRSHPIASRRYNLFNSKQPKGMPWTEYLPQLHELAEEAEVFHINFERLMAMLYISSCTDEELRQKLLGKPDAGRRELYDIGREHDSVKSDAKASLDRAKLYKTEAKERKPSKKPNKEREKEKEMKCYRCGKTNHRSKDCTLPKDTICKNCGKAGHLQRICQGKKKETAKQVTRSQQNHYNESESSEEEEQHAVANNIRHRAFALGSQETPTMLL